MKESDLPRVPSGFRQRVSAASTSIAADELQRLGYLAASPEDAARMTDPTYPALRLAMVAFQLAHGLKPDGLLGPITGGALHRAIAEVSPHSIGDAAAAPRFTVDLSDAFLSAVAAMAERYRAAGARVAAEDFLQVWTFESGLRNIQTFAVNPKTGQRYGNAGLNQMGSQERGACGFRGSLEDWLALSLVDQLPFVDCFYKSAAGFGGGPRSLTDATALYVATFAPAHMAHASDPDFPLYSDVRQHESYQANRGLDYRGRGFISPSDLTRALQVSARNPRFVEARARVRALGAAPAAPPASGGSVAGSIASVLFLLGAVGASAWYGAHS